MSDVSQGSGWWQASDGKWYPPRDPEQAPAPGYWLASDGNWYPPVESEQAPGPGYWLAADGKWYPPATDADTTVSAPGAAPDNPPATKPAVPTASATPRPGNAKAAAVPKPAAPKPATAAKPAAAAKPTTAPLPTPKPAVAPKPVAARPVAAAKPSTAPVASASGRARSTDLNSSAPPKAPAKPVASSATPTPKPARATKSASSTSAAATTAAEHGKGGAAPSGIGYGLNPVDQIRVRNEQSKRDAQVLAGARRMAATRALGSLQGLIDDEKAAQGRDLRESPAKRDRDAPTDRAQKPAAAPSPSARSGQKASPKPSAKTSAQPAPKSSPTAPSKSTGTDSTARVAAASNKPPTPVNKPAPGSIRGSAPVVDGPMRSSEPPLLEVKQGALAADLEHIGERLAIFNDRVELHDRNDRVRQMILGRDIADVVVHKKFTGSTVTVESGTGETIVAKGLKPDQADEIRTLILKRTRLGPTVTIDGEVPIPAPPVSTPATSAAPRPAAKPTKAPAAEPKPTPTTGVTRLNETDLLKKLLDLHRVGVLTDDELAEKTDLLQRLARGETLASTSPTS